MDRSSKVSFPTDRSLVGVASGRNTVSVALGSISSRPDGRPAVELVAFAALFVFARLLQQETVQARVVADAGARDGSPIAADFAADSTLAAALATLRTGTNADGAEIDLTIRERTCDFAASGIVLTYLWDAEDLHLWLDFDAAQLAPISAADFLEKIGLVLERLGIEPGTRCGDLVLLTRAARALIPDLAQEIPSCAHEFIPSVFFRVAAKHAQHPAIANDTATYTYTDLSRTVSHLANRLLDSGLAVGETVAISGCSSFGVLAGLLAVLTAGGVVVTLDQTLPEDRRTLIAQLSCARLKILVRPRGTAGQPDVDTIVTTDWPNRAELDALRLRDPPSPALAADAKAYIFFTSGSTGVPKGVLGTHIGLAHFIEWQRSNFHIGHGDHTAQLTALSFDVVLRDILFPLTSGACIHIPRRETLLDARRMLKWIADTGITVMHCVPSLMRAWLPADNGNRSFRSLRYIFFAGEPLTDALLTRFIDAAGPDTRIVNLYGPTETVLAKLANRINSVEPGVQPVGNPLPGTDVLIVRDRSVSCGLWEIGEIAIRTPYRSKGYVGNEALTRQVFVSNPTRDDPEDLLYYTGDLGRYRSDGKVEIFGRIDAQIKIRGIRIEPNEIESYIIKLPGIRDAVITTRIAFNSEKVLVGLVVPETAVAAKDQAEFSRQIRKSLKQKLPEAMVPARVFPLDKLPYLPNGKLDRKSIGAMELDMEGDESSSATLSAHLGDRTRRLVAGFEESLGVKIASVDNSFVDLGGDSLSYIRVSMIIEDILGWIPPGWEKQSLAELSRLSKATGGAAARSWWTQMDCTVLFRAISIFVVTLSHTGNHPFFTATSALFVISGVNFSKFLRPGLRETGDLGPTLQFISRFAIPAALWQAARGLSLHQFWLPDLLLLGTFFENPNGAHFTFWFLDVLAANVVILALISKFGHKLHIRKSATKGRRETSFWTDLLWCLGALGIAFAQVTSGWLDGDPGETDVAPFKWLWMLALGILITQANSKMRKALVTGLLGCLAVVAYSGLPHVARFLGQTDAFVFASVLALLWIDRVPVPRLLQRPLLAIAASTLFIYIVNYSVINRVMPHMGLPAWWPLQVGLALATGIVAKLVWDRVAGWVVGLVKRGRWRLPAVKAYWPRPFGQIAEKIS